MGLPRNTQDTSIDPKYCVPMKLYQDVQISSHHAGFRHILLDEGEILGFDIVIVVGNRRGSGVLAVEDPLLRDDAVESWVLV